MKRDYRIVVAVILGVLACVGVALNLMTPRSDVIEPAVPQSAEGPRVKAPSTPLPRPDPSLASKPELPQKSLSSTGRRSLETTSSTNTSPVKLAGRSVAQPSQGSGKPPPQDLAARAALSFVGIDPAAEEYWESAINDASLSATERQDLIEDLNEDGLADPRGGEVADLPLIINRMFLIEGLAPFAMDDVNAAAFEEAYKDLVNLADKLTAAAAADGQ